MAHSPAPTSSRILPLSKANAPTAEGVAFYPSWHGVSSGLFEGHLALLVEFIDIVAEAHRALAIGPGGDVGGVNRHARLAFDIEALKGSKGRIDPTLIPIAIVAQQPGNQL